MTLEEFSQTPLYKMNHHSSTFKYYATLEYGGRRVLQTQRDIWGWNSKARKREGSIFKLPSIPLREFSS